MTGESDDDPILDGEDIACLGMRRVDAWSLFPARTDEDWEKLFAALQAAKGKPPKPRKPSIKKLVKQAEQASGMVTAPASSSPAHRIPPPSRIRGSPISR